MKYPESELVIGEGNTIYHLGVARENLATTILLVGDQDRVKVISSFFDKITFQSQNREFVIHTGIYHEKFISVVSTGIGTDNIDIVINELDAVFNINFNTREDEENFTKLNLIRIGTCGILQPEIPVHSFIVSKSAYGFDNVAHFYQMNFSNKEVKAQQEIDKLLQLPEKIHPYLSEGSSQLLEKFSSDETVEGITMTSCGFYGPQGRTLRIPHRLGTIYEKLIGFTTSSGDKVLNFEMETSALYALGKALGHECLTICLGAANRPNKEFSDDYHPHMKRLIEYVLNRI